jgi:hypothetical protein
LNFQEYSNELITLQASRSISTDAQYVSFAKIFLASKISYLLSFPTPPIKLKLGLQTGERLLTATHLDQSNYLANHQHVLGFAVHFTLLHDKSSIVVKLKSIIDNDDDENEIPFIFMHS